MIDPIIRLSFSVFENRGVYAVLLGSGLSRAAHIPTGWEITLDLIRKIAALGTDDVESDPAAWYRKTRRKEPSYSDLLDELARTADERRSILHGYIEPNEEDRQAGRKVPTKAHRAIAEMVRGGYVRVILTTNFDRLTEGALSSLAIAPTVIRSDDDLAGAVPLVHSACTIVKLHGDYLDTRIKNTETELDAYSPAMNAYLDHILDQHGLIVYGWSAAWDGGLRKAIERAPNRRYSTFWAAKGDLTPEARDLATRRAAQVLPIEDADSFFVSVAEKIAIQTEMKRSHPETTELLVATAKSYVARLEHRIRLADLTATLCRRVIASDTASEFGVGAPLAAEEFRRRVMRYEAIADDLARVLAVLGRWGEGSEVPIVLDGLRALGARESQNGALDWINLRSYPAVLALYCYGLGALKARRFDLVWSLYSLPLRKWDGEVAPLVTQTFLFAWGDMSNKWKWLFPGQTTRTPISDHLHDLLRSRTGDIVLTGEEYETLFNLFETLGSLAFLSCSYTSKQLGEHLEGPAPHNFAWAPCGRVAWQGRERDRLFAAIKEPDFKAALVNAGFAHRDPSFFDRAMISLERLMQKFAY